MFKRGLSEIVSYVLLIVIAISMAGLVFVFLNAYVPKGQPECKEGVSLIIETVSCTHIGGKNQIIFTLQNRGLFKVDKVYLRIGQKDRTFREDIKTPNPQDLYHLACAGPPLDTCLIGLNPQELTISYSFDLPSSYSAVGSYIFEIQPAHYTKEEDIESLALCPPINQQITCN